MSKTLEQKLCKRSLGYLLTRELLVRPAFHLFYRRVDVIGAKAVPATGPVIFTPNHQNALMDALAVLCTKDRQPVFVARADIFKKPLIIAVFNFLRILPIYRKRDGGSSSDNNQETFDLILKVLNSEHSVGIMPEGTHSEIKRLRVLQKGVFRLAMQAQESHGNTPKIKIAPVGIEYSIANSFRSDVIIRYGATIEVSDFYDKYVENPARAFKMMQDTLTEKMKEGMVHIDSDYHYFEIERLRVMYQQQAALKLGLNLRNAEHRLQTQKKIVETLHNYALTNKDEMDTLGLAVIDYYDILKRYNLCDNVIKHQPYSLAALLGRCILALPVIPFWILGLLFNYLPYKLSVLATHRVKDPQFISSVQYVAAIIFFPVYHLIMITLMIIFIPCIWGKIILPLLMLPLGFLAYNYYNSLKMLASRFRYLFIKRNIDIGSDLKEAVELRKRIFEKMDEIF